MVKKIQGESIVKADMIKRHTSGQKARTKKERKSNHVAWIESFKTGEDRNLHEDATEASSKHVPKSHRRRQQCAAQRSDAKL